MRTDVSFQSAGLKIAGHLYMPRTVPADGRAIVVGHPGSGVKEQAAGLYAQKLCDNGLVALTFDAAFQGESEGQPRGREDPAQRVEDIKAAVSFLSVHPQVDPAKIGALGICASGGYLAMAAASDRRIKAVATVSAADIGLQFRLGADGRQDPVLLNALLEAAGQARTAAARGEPIGTFPIFPADEVQARAGGQHLFEGWDYYCTDRARHPRSAKTLTWDSVDRIATFDAFRFIDMISPRPLLMIVGEQAVTSWMTTQAMARAAEPKDIHWIKGATHVALYDRQPYVDEAVARLAVFFRAALG